MSLMGKKVGIWGFGIVGKSALSYLHSKGAIIHIVDAKPVSEMDQKLIHDYGASWSLQTDIIPFLEYNDYILPSPGINLTPYQSYSHKWLAELDLFAAEKKEQHAIIAITGTVGKTSITHLLGQLLNAHGSYTAVGGNIGTGMLDLIPHSAPTTLLELSSFQLELCSTFAPDLALWTNFYPNHLDRHPTASDYFNAKFRIIAHQKPSQKALLPIALLDSIYTTHRISSSCSFFMNSYPSNDIYTKLSSQDSLFYRNETHIMRYHNQQHLSLIALDDLPPISYQENWLIIVSALHLLNIPLDCITRHAKNLTIPEHRLEKVATINAIDFYNDSKSTTPEATLAAITQLQSKPIHLFLGGISKGIDRTPLIQHLTQNIVHVYCFGREADTLHTLCHRYGIESSPYNTIDAALQSCTQKMQPGEQVLFSPSGASFDLFANYSQRGDYFKKLVRSLSISTIREPSQSRTNTNS